MISSFEILAPILKERALTETLRYLLDSRNPHNLGDMFFRQLIACSNLSNLILPQKKLIITATSEWTTAEHKRIDILIVAKEKFDKAPSIVIGVEGKITATESPQQISNYQAAISKSFSQASKGIILLTPDKRATKTADNSNSYCPVSSVSWNQVAEFSKQHFGRNSFVMEFANYLTTFINPSSTMDGKQVVQFFNNSVLPVIQKAIDNNGEETKIEWYYPKAKPKEFNISHKSINTVSNRLNLKFFYMFYCPAGVPKVGKQIHLLLMAFREGGFEEKVSNKLEELSENYLPPIEGGKYEWGPWKCLWSNGCITLADIGELDVNALKSIYIGAYNRTAEQLSKGIRMLLTK